MDGHLLRFNKKARYCFVDVETYNLCLNMEYNRPWQYGLVEVVGNEVINRKEILVKWPPSDTVKCSAEAARINHYNENKVNSEGISPIEALRILDEMFQKADYIVGHNILGFDAYLIREHYNQCVKDWRFIMPKILDTRALVLGIKTGYKYNKGDDLLRYQYQLINTPHKGVKTSLQALLKEYEIDFNPHLLHDAVYDIEKNAELWNKMKFEIEI